MNKFLQIPGLLFLTILLNSPLTFAQDDETAPPPETGVEETAAESEAKPAGQEVEINEDNYRNFMELRDTRQQRDIIPEDAFKAGSGLNKLDKLPEESQKHLRNELREIIVQGDQWQPGDEETEYPYVPSEAARTSQSLQKQETEAWGELVDGYHEREAEIYANASRSAAAAADAAANGKPGEGSGDGEKSADGESGEGSQGQQAGQQASSDQGSSSEGTYSPNASNDPNATSTEGVSQNAMEFLKGLGKQGGNPGEGGGSSTAGNSSQGNAQAQAGQEGSSEQAGQEGSSEQTGQEEGSEQTGQEGSSEQTGQEGGSEQTGQQQSSAQAGAEGSSPPDAAQDPNSTSTAGASQNAMEFLKGNASQGGDTGEGSADSSTGSDGQTSGQEDGQESAQADSQGDAQSEGQDEAQENNQENAQADGQADAQEDGDGQSQAGQQSEDEQSPDQATSPAPATPTPINEPEAESTEGTSQNALEYLMGEDDQPGGNTADEPNINEQGGTLTIEDLLNAQGVGTSTAPPPTIPDDEQKPDENTPDPDGGG